MAIRMHILEAGETFRVVGDALPPVQGVITRGQESYSAPGWGIHPISPWAEVLPTLPLPSEIDRGIMDPRIDQSEILIPDLDADAEAGKGKKKGAKKAWVAPLHLDHGRLVDALLLYLADEGYPVGLGYDLDDDDAAFGIWSEHTSTYNSSLMSASREAADKVMSIGAWMPWATLATFLLFLTTLFWRIGWI